MAKQAIATMDFGGTTADMNVIKVDDFRQVFPDRTFNFSVDKFDLDSIVHGIKDGLGRAILQAGQGYEVLAVSFAFPGPADYKNGMIGALNNVPAFQKYQAEHTMGYPLGAEIREILGKPVFINNDGDLFAEGERIAGVVPYFNEKAQWTIDGCIGLTLGSGLGCGSSDAERGMYVGRSGTGLEFGVNGTMFDGREVRFERPISRYGMVELFNARVGEKYNLDVDHKDSAKLVEEYARGENLPHGSCQGAALAAITKFGYELGHAMTLASNMMDQPIIVLGGGLAHAYDLFIDGAMNFMRGTLDGEVGPGGEPIKRLMKQSYNLENDADRAEFLKTGNVFGNKKVGVCKSVIGTARAIYVGAAGYAMAQLGKS